MKSKFVCFYERDEKGIYMEVDTESYTTLVGFTFFADFKVVGEVCLEKKDIEKLIGILQEKLVEKDAPRISTKPVVSGTPLMK